MKQHGVSMASATLLASVLVSCGTNDHPDTRAVDAGGVTVLAETERFTGLARGVGVFGTLELVKGRCVGFTFGGQPTLIVFPGGTAVHGRGRNLVVSVGDVELRLGDHFEAGSRENGSRALSNFGDLDRQTPARCRSAKALPVEEFAKQP
ncbi:MAG TPA: hypothetical protein VFE07_02110 [Marmoricola sp.]|nr:hypothetical protein [Marmoricola sp.]